MAIKGIIEDIWSEPFNRWMILVLLLLGLGVFFIQGNTTELQDTGTLDVHFFYHPSCPHCQAQKVFNEKLIDKYPDAKFIYHNTEDKEVVELLKTFAEDLSIPQSELGVPFTIIDDYYHIGYDTDETTGAEIENVISSALSGEVIEEHSGSTNGSVSDLDAKYTLDLPLFGEIDALDYSLPALAVVLGFVDGFNPCAMWVLVFLISIIMELRDKRKIWLLVGSFVFASGVLYFLFMTAWLNVFLFLGFARPVTLFVGLVALGFGVISIREFIKTKGALECKVGDIQQKKKTMQRIQDVVSSPLTLATVGAMIILAFVVNSIEFACSAAIPAVFTQVLAISDISGIQHYSYILLYTLFFMLDDLVIFSLAAFAVSTSIGDKYAKYCKILGGILLVVIGIVLVFFPQILQ